MDTAHSYSTVATPRLGLLPGGILANVGLMTSTVGPGLPSSTEGLDLINSTTKAWATGTVPPPDPAFGIALACLTIPVVLFGIFANAVVLFIVIRFDNMHNVINYSFANLALADLLGLLLDALPAIILTLKNYGLTDPGCRVLLYLPWTIRQAACLTLAYLAFDRYRLIIQPTSSTRWRSPPYVLTALAVIWIVSGILQLPTAVLTGLNDAGSCREYRPSRGGAWYYWVKVLTVYLFPLAVIAFCYFKIWRRLSAPRRSSTRSGSIKMRTFRKRSARRILIIVAIFAVLWMPIFVVHLWPHYDVVVTEDSPSYVYVHRVTNFGLYLSMMLNPFLYAFAGQGFKKHFKKFGGQTISSSTGDLDREQTPEGK
ncbi:somatostatin receptor type 2-like [Diadema setosum]|uniref:somatostatin receptor type 2-like n=1 Tax=Diadema setosum TaxID=31175 RepID=UPI003B3BD6B1